MSKIAILGSATGTGTVTVAAPVTNTDQTLTLPDRTATLVATNTAGTAVQFPDGTTQSTAATAPTTAIVLNATAGATAGAVGTYCFGYNVNLVATSTGGTLAGSSIRGRDSNGTVLNPSFAGTWRNMGASNADNQNALTLWLRIS